MKLKRHKVSIITGGSHPHHHTRSRASAETIAAHLRPEKYEVNALHVNNNNEWEIPSGELKKMIDVAFPVTHGVSMRHETMQDILRKDHIPYVGSDSAVHMLAFNRQLSLGLLKTLGIEVPLGMAVPRVLWDESPSLLFDQIKHYIGYPVIIRPNFECNHENLTIAHTEDDLAEQLDVMFSKDSENEKTAREAVVHHLIPGHIVSCIALDHGWSESSYPLVPIAMNEEGDKVLRSHSVEKGMRQLSNKIHRALHCTNFSETIAIIDQKNNITVIEVNTVPYATAESNFVRGVEQSNLSLAHVFDVLVSGALRKE